VEIEAKFTIPDEETFQRLLAAPALGGFNLASPALLHVRDRYLDTPTGAIRAGGYACRLRREDDRSRAPSTAALSTNNRSPARYPRPIGPPAPSATWFSA
jgi:hypothetical protein